MRSTLILAVLLAAFLYLTASAHSATIVVPDDYATIQAAIDASVNGDTVLVKPDTYVENLDFKGKAITVISEQGPDVTVIDGNQAGSVVTFMTSEGSDSVLDGFTLTNGMATSSGGGVYCWQTAPKILNNIITGNRADFFAGGGIYCYGDLVIRNNVITSNESSNMYPKGCGGGIHIAGGSPVVEDNFISENLALGRAGGGIYCDSGTAPVIRNNEILKNTTMGNGGGISCEYPSSPLIENNLISENRAYDDGGGIGFTYYVPLTGGQGDGYLISILGNVIENNEADTGGGIFCDLADTKISDNIIKGNEAIEDGGGIGCRGANPVITNNLVYDNFALECGGGISFWMSDPELRNNTIYSNTSVEYGGGIFCEYHSHATDANAILWDNQAATGPEVCIMSASQPSDFTTSYSDVEGGQAAVHADSGCTLNWGAGMIDKDPKFVDGGGLDLHLTYNSSCRDAGDDAAVLDPNDFEGDPRIAYGAVDMGADEFHTHLYYTGDATPGGRIELKFVELPGFFPIGYWLAFNVLETPVSGAFGDWYLLPPMFGSIFLMMFPMDGVLVIPGTLPATPPGPYSLYLQAILGMSANLTNLCEIHVK